MKWGEDVPAGFDLSSLRVLGFTRMEVSQVLLTELLLVVIVAQPLGWALGAGFATLVTDGFASDLFQIQPLPASITSVSPQYVSPGTTRLLRILGDNLTPGTSYAASAGSHQATATNWVSINEAELEYTAPTVPQLVPSVTETTEHSSMAAAGKYSGETSLSP